mmetsp:Transcript_32464/g.37802  ORF Transcript_32464/g.37802 Transcript_32464/m.37802 type:complete len:105 (-) Transcript_32464:76-390(-)
MIFNQLVSLSIRNPNLFSYVLPIRKLPAESTRKQCIFISKLTHNTSFSSSQHFYHLRSSCNKQPSLGNLLLVLFHLLFLFRIMLHLLFLLGNLLHLFALVFLLM